MGRGTQVRRRQKRRHGGMRRGTVVAEGAKANMDRGRSKGGSGQGQEPSWERWATSVPGWRRRRCGRPGWLAGWLAGCCGGARGGACQAL